MPFHEKSAWIMSAALLLGGAFYLSTVTRLSADAGVLASPSLPILMLYTAVLVGIAVLGHIIVAILSPREAGMPLDERERLIVARAGHYSSFVTGFGVVAALLFYLFNYDGDLLFYGVLAALMLGQLMEYVLQILLYRSAL